MGSPPSLSPASLHAVCKPVASLSGLWAPETQLESLSSPPEKCKQDFEECTPQLLLTLCRAFRKPVLLFVSSSLVCLKAAARPPPQGESLSCPLEPAPAFHPHQPPTLSPEAGHLCQKC